LLQQFIRENPQFYATPRQVIGIAVRGGSDRRRCCRARQSACWGRESFVARLTTRIGGARECSAVRSDTKAEAFWKW